jgi:hypothetical protein
MGINKRICPVCGEEKLSIFRGKIIKIKCRYCCHHGSGKNIRKAFRDLWQDALNADEVNNSYEDY